MAALIRSSLPASGSRYSGSSRGPTTSSSPITGSAGRNTEPHQKRSSSSPPISGPIAAPAEKLVIHTPIAKVRSRGWSNMLRISDSVDGASVAPATPSSARAAISISALVESAANTRGEAERAGADQEQAAAADPVAQRPHRDQQPGDQEAVDVHDPQQLRAARLQVLAQRRQREVEHGQIHRVDQARKRDHGEADPLAAPGPGRTVYRHASRLEVEVIHA